MTDPAAEAAERSWDNWNWGGNQPFFSLAVAAAREALRPIRELHYPRENSVSAMYPDPLCNCDQDWPCDTARLIYSESEL